MNFDDAADWMVDIARRLIEHCENDPNAFIALGVACAVLREKAEEE